MVSANLIERTIIQDIGAYSEYPFEAIEEPVLNLLKRASSQVRKCGTPVIKAFECFFQITNGNLTMEMLCDKQFLLICQTFIGAIYSSNFYQARTPQRYAWANLFISILRLAKHEQPALIVPKIDISTMGLTDYVKSGMDQFEAYSLNEEKIWLWSGWPSTNRSGRTTWLPLYLIYTRLGREYTQRLHKVCDEYYSGRKSQRIIALQDLARFIHSHPKQLTPDLLKSASFSTQFWREFFVYYIESGHANGIEISLLITNWRNEFQCFAREYLFASGLFTEPYGSLPSPKPHRILGHKTHISKSAEGVSVRNKLITPIPLQLTDSEAIELLFKKIELDYKIITEWASWAVEEIWHRYRRRIELASTGSVRKIFPKNSYVRYEPGEFKHSDLNKPVNPDHKKNIAATFAHHGYLSCRDKNFVQILYPTPRDQHAIELALPITSALLPHCTLLVARHPKITPSFLENFQLYDKHGQRTGLHKTDAGYALDGRKNRSGPITGQQVVILTHETAKIVFQIILLTNPLREYLKARGDDNWRYLLLTCGKGFAYPLRIQRLATDTSLPERLELLAHSLGNTSTLSYESRLEYANRFSLPALRAQAAVLIYLKERSASKMSEALGHARYSEQLLDRYLPRPIRDFFQERWIRIFQTGIVAEALKDSPYILQASGFSTMEDLHQFLLTHMLKKLDDPLELRALETKENNSSCPPSSKSEVVFGLNPDILTAMISLRLAVQQATDEVCGKAKYWAGITEQLIQHIDSNACIRQDLKTYLHKARADASPDKFYQLIYE